MHLAFTQEDFLVLTVSFSQHLDPLYTYLLSYNNLFAEYVTICLLLTRLASKSVVGALTEYRSYDTVNGLYTLPEGTIMDRTQLESLSPVEYVDQLFARVATMQALKLTEIEEHLLKSISVFNPGTKIRNSKISSAPWPHTQNFQM